jgi:putative hydrolase of the HAD superfamily
MTTTVLFDLDDTIFDHHHSCLCGLEAIRDEIPPAKDMSLEEFEQLYRHWLEIYHVHVLSGEMTPTQSRRARIRAIIEHFRQEAETEKIDRLGTCYRLAYQENRRAVPGSLELVKHLKAQGIKIGIVTNNLAEEQEEKVDFLGLRPWQDALVISDAVGVAKPDPQIFRIALERIDVAAEQTVMVGDSWTSDVKGAQAAGIRAVWFNRFEHPPPEPDALILREFEPVEESSSLLLNQQLLS